MVQGRYGSVSYKTKQNKPIPKEKWIRVEGTHEPIIDKDLWDRTQELIQQRAKPFIGGEIGLFAKKAICMYCGYTLRSSKHHNEHYLRCPTRYASQEACQGCMVSVNTLEKAVLEELHKLNEQYLDEERLGEQANFNHRTLEPVSYTHLDVYKRQPIIPAHNVP